MRLEVKEVNFTMEKEWIFKLSDGFSDYYILDYNGYKLKELKNPITKHELDYLDVGSSILCETEESYGLSIVTRIYKY